jgi:hypothetical protein
MDNRALVDSCRLAAALVADIGDTHAASWLITSAVLLATVLPFFSDQNRDSGRCRGRLVRGQRKSNTQVSHINILCTDWTNKCDEF